jgi:hypothetical protein
MVPVMANTNTREAQQRARSKLAERRQREDQLIEAVTKALVTREEATEALAAAEASLTDAVTGLADLGIARDELAAILEVPAEQLGAKTRGRPRRGSTPNPPVPAADGSAAGEAEVVAEPAEKPARPAARARKARATARPNADGS